MARESRLDRATIFQLHALAAAARHGDYGVAAREMGVPDKHRLVKAVDRLGKNLGLSFHITGRVGDEPVVSPARRPPTEAGGLAS